jgi:hypothetical protein
VPEDSVRPETQTLVIINRHKGFVGCFLLSFCYKELHSYSGGEIFESLNQIEVKIILRVRLISAKAKGNTRCEGSFPGND